MIKLMKEAFGGISLVLALVSYAPYIRDIFRGKTKPHALSWLVWASLAGIAFAVQVTNNGGPGSWQMGFTFCMTLLIFFLSLKRGERNILVVDWASLVAAGFALLLWFITDQPLTSILLISLVDIVGGFFPTFRKSIRNPHQETISSYFIYAVSLIFSLLALTDFSLVNALYPASFIFINASMGLFLIARRRQLAPATN